MKNIVFYGGGNISQAVIEGLIFSGFSPKNIFFVDRNIRNQNKLKKLKIRSFKSNQKDKIDLFILAVKPKDAIEAYKEIVNIWNSTRNRFKVISFVAGIKLKKYKEAELEVCPFGDDIELLRAMPNTSSRYGLGITAIYNFSFYKTNLKKVITLLKRIGIVITISSDSYPSIDNESKIDTFTGIIGSGPAYFFHLLQSYEKKLLTLSNGDKKIVNSIMSNLMKGVGMSIEKDTNLDSLIEAVASKKGTTEAGLKSFKLNKLSNRFEKGLNAAIKRSKEISNEF